MISLEQALGTYALPIEHDGLEFRLVPCSTAEITEWQAINQTPRTENESAGEWNARIRDAQLEFMAKKLRASVTEGSAKKVTPKWVAEKVPNVILGDLADFLIHGQRPEWAGESGN